MFKRWEFWLAFLVTLIVAAQMSELIPPSPAFYGKLAAFGLLVLHWINAVAGNPIKSLDGASSSRQGGFTRLRVLLAIAAVGAVTLIACSYCNVAANKGTKPCKIEQATKVCAAETAAPVPAQAGETILDIITSGGASWQADLEALAAKIGGSDGMAFISCEVAAIETIYSAPTIGSVFGIVTPSSIIVARAHAWQVVHPAPAKMRAALSSARCG